MMMMMMTLSVLCSAESNSICSSDLLLMLLQFVISSQAIALDSHLSIHGQVSLSLVN
jgi:hypothetical protein